MLLLKSFLLSFSISFLHPFFVSVVDIKHSTKDKNIEISIRVFTDDLETTLKKNYKQNIDLATGSSKAEANTAVANYIQSKLQISVDGKPKTLMYVGYEVKKESTWIYVEINDIATIKKLNLACNLLYEFQEKQSNIINATVNSIEKNYKLDNPKSTVEFSW